ncbi:MAG: ferrous iron transport protein A [Sphingomonadales bacterium]|nr:MAG: ferrous iron transport protein A [Sphingomonadales bacterium]
MTLDSLPRGSSATITSIVWDSLAPEEVLRLRALGIDEGAEITIAHRGVFGGGGPLAITLGRMTIALRRDHAAAMNVEVA